MWLTWDVLSSPQGQLKDCAISGQGQYRWTDGRWGGRVGDLSGRVGDLSGRVGNLSGRVGDLSGCVGISNTPTEISNTPMTVFLNMEVLVSSHSQISTPVLYELAPPLALPLWAMLTTLYCVVEGEILLADNELLPRMMLAVIVDCFIIASSHSLFTCVEGLLLA